VEKFREKFGPPVSEVLDPLVFTPTIQVKRNRAPFPANITLDSGLDGAEQPINKRNTD